MRERTPEQWCALIDGITERIVRVQVACIVWWDWAPEHQKWTCFEHYLAKWRKTKATDADKVCAALLGLGYLERIAKERCKVLFDMAEFERKREEKFAALALAARGMGEDGELIWRHDEQAIG